MCNYTDGTPVQPGDHIRYHQAPGGLMAPPRHFVNGEYTIWREGVAVLQTDHFAESVWGPHALLIEYAPGYYAHLHGHVIERLLCSYCLFYGEEVPYTAEHAEEHPIIAEPVSA